MKKRIYTNYTFKTPNWLQQKEVSNGSNVQKKLMLKKALLQKKQQ
jgi:hypothetical protein